MEKRRAFHASQSRTRLDRRVREVGAASRFAPPAKGWLRAIREALGMSTAQLARRLGMKQPSVIAMEKSEAKGTIQMSTLRKAAAAMDCVVVYALVPRRPLEVTVRSRARALLMERKEAVAHSMALEGQATRRRGGEARVSEFLRVTDPARLWDEP